MLPSSWVEAQGSPRTFRLEPVPVVMEVGTAEACQGREQEAVDNIGVPEVAEAL